MPESFKVLIKEMQSLALDIKVLDENEQEVELKEMADYEETGLGRIMRSDETGEDSLFASGFIEEDVKSNEKSEAETLAEAINALDFGDKEDGEKGENL